MIWLVYAAAFFAAIPAAFVAGCWFGRGTTLRQWEDYAAADPDPPRRATGAAP